MGTGAEGNNSKQGSAITLSSDGSTAFVGGYDDDASLGAAWVFVRGRPNVQAQAAAVGTVFNFTVSALDGNNAPLANCAGKVHFTSSDGAALLPGTPP